MKKYIRLHCYKYGIVVKSIKLYDSARVKYFYPILKDRYDLISVIDENNDRWKIENYISWEK